MKDQILFVDDDPNLLAGIQRQLRGQYQVTTANGSAEGLLYIEESGPFAVVVADMRMPGQDGIQFLSKVRQLAPDSIRIMLTGFADLETSINAVNEGHIYRFLTKPCPAETLERALQAGLKQYHLVQAERELLEKTLVGSVRMLMEILSMVNPAAFGSAARLRRVALHIARQLKLPDIWQYELAAALSQIGWITFQPDLLAKVIAHKPLSDREQHQYSKHPAVGRKLLEKIPRLERIAAMIEGQANGKGNFELAFVETEADQITLGAQLLRVAVDYDQQIMSGMSHTASLDLLERRKYRYVAEMVEALRSLEGPGQDQPSEQVASLRLEELREGMVLAEAITSPSGEVVIGPGQELTYPLITYLYSQAQYNRFLNTAFKVYGA